MNNSSMSVNSVEWRRSKVHNLLYLRCIQGLYMIDQRTLLDEADLFPPGQQADARDVSERYIAKSDPYKCRW
jgi:hypothetical protein